MKKNGLAGLVGVCLYSVLVALLAAPALAVDTHWILPPPDEGNWSDPSNWDNGVPLLNPEIPAYIDNGGTALHDSGPGGTWYLYVGNSASGHVVQTGGTMRVVYHAYLGYDIGSYGSYFLEDGYLETGWSSAGYQDTMHVGRAGTGLFRQTGGEHKLTNNLYLGTNSTGEGRYEISDGILTVNGYLQIGNQGTGVMHQEGGTVDATDIYLAWKGGDGSYELHDGTLDVYRDVRLYSGASFTQLGGTHTCGYYLEVYGDFHLAGGTLVQGANYSGGDATIKGTFIQENGTVFEAKNDMSVSGTYELRGGQLSAHWLFASGGGTFVQTGGTCSPGTLVASGDGTVRLDAGDLHVRGYAKLGRYASSGKLVQNGGVCTIDGWLEMGGYNPYPGIYTISGGSLSVPRITMGYDGPGILNITTSSPHITVSQQLQLGPRADLNVVPGAKIHMTGAAFQNESKDPDALAGLGNLNLIFEGGTADTDPFEVAGKDQGAVWGGFVKNFTLGQMTLGGADVGCVRLVDNFDNGNRGGPAGAAEAQYVKRLQVGAGSTLNLNNLNLYYLSGAIDPSATILPGAGSLTWVPPVASVNATFLDSAFTPTGGDHDRGMLTVADGADVVVEIGDGTQTTYAGGQFTLAVSLFSDTSTGGVAAGLFQGGTIDIEDALGADLLTGDLVDLLLEEIQGQNLLAGSGWFEVTGGSLEGGFLESVGKVVQITFQIAPSDIEDFSGGFTGVSNITLTPEPATLGLLAAGLGAIWMGKRQGTKGQRD